MVWESPGISLPRRRQRTCGRRGETDLGSARDGYDFTHLQQMVAAHFVMSIEIIEIVANPPGRVARDQNTSQVDPDGASTLHLYSPQGDRAFTIANLAQSPTIHWAGPDRRDLHRRPANQAVVTSTATESHYKHPPLIGMAAGPRGRYDAGRNIRI